MGFDPAVLVEVVQERGVETARMEGAVQRLRRGEGSTGADPVNPRLLDFWQVGGGSRLPRRIAALRRSKLRETLQRSSNLAPHAP